MKYLLVVALALGVGTAYGFNPDGGILTRPVLSTDQTVYPADVPIVVTVTGTDLYAKHELYLGIAGGPSCEIEKPDVSTTESCSFEVTLPAGTYSVWGSQEFGNYYRSFDPVTAPDFEVQ